MTRATGGFFPPQIPTSVRTQGIFDKGSIVYDEDLETFFVGDGATAGGIEFLGTGGRKPQFHSVAGESDRLALRTRDGVEQGHLVYQRSDKTFYVVLTVSSTSITFDNRHLFEDWTKTSNPTDEIPETKLPSNIARVPLARGIEEGDIPVHSEELDRYIPRSVDSNPIEFARKPFSLSRVVTAHRPDAIGGYPAGLYIPTPNFPELSTRTQTITVSTGAYIDNPAVTVNLLGSNHGTGYKLKVISRGFTVNDLDAYGVDPQDTSSYTFANVESTLVDIEIDFSGVYFNTITIPREEFSFDPPIVLPANNLPGFTEYSYTLTDADGNDISRDFSSVSIFSKTPQIQRAGSISSRWQGVALQRELEVKADKDITYNVNRNDYVSGELVTASSGLGTVITYRRRTTGEQTAVTPATNPPTYLNPHEDGTAWELVGTDPQDVVDNTNHIFSIQGEVQELVHEVNDIPKDPLGELPEDDEYTYTASTVLTEARIIKSSNDNVLSASGLFLVFDDTSDQVTNNTNVGDKFYLGDNQEVGLRLVDKNVEVSGLGADDIVFQFKVLKGYDTLRQATGNSASGDFVVDTDNDIFNTFYTRTEVEEDHYLVRKVGGSHRFEPINDIRPTITTVEDTVTLHEPVTDTYVNLGTSPVHQLLVFETSFFQGQAVRTAQIGFEGDVSYNVGDIFIFQETQFAGETTYDRASPHWTMRVTSRRVIGGGDDTELFLERVNGNWSNLQALGLEVGENFGFDLNADSPVLTVFHDSEEFGVRRIEQNIVMKGGYHGDPNPDNKTPLTFENTTGANAGVGHTWLSYLGVGDLDGNGNFTLNVTQTGEATEVTFSTSTGVVVDGTRLASNTEWTTFINSLGITGGATLTFNTTQGLLNDGDVVATVAQWKAFVENLDIDGLIEQVSTLPTGTVSADNYPPRTPVKLVTSTGINLFVQTASIGDAIVWGQLLSNKDNFQSIADGNATLRNLIDGRIGMADISELSGIPDYPTSGDQFQIPAYDRINQSWSYRPETTGAITNNITNNISSSTLITDKSQEANGISYYARLYELSDGTTTTYTYSVNRLNVDRSIDTLRNQTIASETAFNDLDLTTLIY